RRHQPDLGLLNSGRRLLRSGEPAFRRNVSAKRPRIGKSVVGGARIPGYSARDTADSRRLHAARVVFVRPSILNVVESCVHGGTALLLNHSDTGQRQSADDPGRYTDTDRREID